MSGEATDTAYLRELSWARTQAWLKNQDDVLPFRWCRASLGGMADDGPAPSEPPYDQERT